MKKMRLFLMAAMAVSLIACQKEIRITPSQPDPVRMTFTASTLDATKTAIGEESEGVYPMVWSAGDQIKVVVTDAEGATVGSGVLDIVGVGGTSSATFTGDITPAAEKTEADFVNFYAAYPATVNPSVTTDGTKITFDGFKSYEVLAVENGIDSSRAAMFAKAEDNKFTFQHGVVYYKLMIGADNISSVELKCLGEQERIYGNPTYTFKDGKTTAVGSGSKNNNHITLAPASGTLTKGAVYYFPVLTKYNAFGNLQLVYTENGGSTCTVQTSKLSAVVPANGQVYNLGCPPVTFGPVIKASDPAVLAADATNGSFTYSVLNGEASEVTFELDGGCTWISGITKALIGEDWTISYTVSENTGDQRSAEITLKLDGAADKVVTVKQAKGASGGSEDYVWDFSTTEWQAALTAQASAACNETNGKKNVASWSVSYDGLSYDSESGDGRWFTEGFIQPNGSGYYESDSKKRRYFSFSTVGAGYLYVSLSGTGGTAKSATVYAQQGYKKSNADGVVSIETASVTNSQTDRVELALPAGDQVMYLSTGMRIRKIEFHTNQLTE